MRRAGLAVAVLAALLRSLLLAALGPRLLPGPVLRLRLILRRNVRVPWRAEEPLEETLGCGGLKT